MADNLGDVIDQDRLSPLAALAAAGQGLWNWGGLAGLPSLRELITGVTNQPPLTISAQNAPQLPPPGPQSAQPVMPSPVTTQMTPYIRGAPGTQSGFAVPDPNALPNVRPNSPLAANTAGIRGFPGTPSGPNWGKPDPYAHMPPPDPPDPPPPMPKPVADTRPDLPGQPGAKEPDHTQWGVSHSPLQDLVTRVTKHLDEQQPIPQPVLNELPRPVSQQVQNSWMSTVLSSAGLLLAAFGSRRSAAPMTAAIKSFGGYLQGYQQGQEEVWKQKQAEYKEQLDYALQRNQLELDRYKVAVEASKGDTEKMHEMLYAASILNEDERGKAELEQGRTSEFFKYVDAKQKWWDQVTAIRDKERLLGITLPEPPEPELPEDLRGYIYGGGGGGRGGGSTGGYTGPIGIAVGIESSGRPTVTGGDTSSGPSRGLLQITDGTWQQYAPTNVKQKWPTAAQAPAGVQIEVGKTIPAKRWGPDTKAAWHAKYGDFDENQTLGQLQQRFGGGIQVAGPGGAPDTGTTPQPATPGQVAEDSPVAQLGREIFRGGEPPQGTDKDEEAYASTYAQNLQKRLDAVAASGLKGQDLIAAVAKIDPVTADRLQAIAANKQQLPASGMSSRLDSYRSSLATLATKVNPRWTPQQWEARQKLRDYYSTGQYGQVLSRSTGLATAAANVLSAINGLKTQDQTVIHNALSELLATGVTGDPRFQTLAAALNQYDIESTAVSMGGVPRVALIQALTRLTPGHASPQALRQVLLTNLRGEDAKIKGLVNSYKRNFPDEGDPPMLDVEGEAAIDQILAHTNPNTGYINLPSDQLSPLLKDAQPYTAEEVQ